MNLERSGAYSVCTENHAGHALETARHFQPNLIFLDVMMPEIDAGHLAAQLKFDPELKSVPVVFLTAIVSPEETTANGAMIAGHFFIAKPASLAALTKCIEERTGGKTREAVRATRHQTVQTAEAQLARAQADRRRPTGGRVRRFFSVLGPRLITGAADDRFLRPDRRHGLAFVCLSVSARPDRSALRR